MDFKLKKKPKEIENETTYSVMGGKSTNMIYLDIPWNKH